MTRWNEELGKNVGRLEHLLQIGKHYDEVIELRRISTLARLVSDDLDEAENDGMVSGR